MTHHAFRAGNIVLEARASGALWLPEARVLVVSDLHLGKSERIARRGGTLLPPYDTTETLTRLDAEIAATQPAQVVCLGDSFDDLQAAALPEAAMLWLTRMMAGRDWVWIEGNHDPGPVALGGSHRADLTLGPLILRHIAQTDHSGGPVEISGHYHPKARLAGQSRPCFVLDARRMILPAFGAYTGGLSVRDPAISTLFGPQALAVLTGRRALAVPLAAVV
jgi:uncharacterized protein